MTALDLAHLKALALKATQGEWYADSVGYSVQATDDPFDGHAIADCQRTGDATFIAAMDPTTALALVDRVEELERECDDLTAARATWKGLTNRLQTACSEVEADRDAYHDMLVDVLASAVPNERDHPAMSKQWKRAEALLATKEPTK